MKETERTYPKCTYCDLPAPVKGLCRRHYKKYLAIKNGTYKKRWEKIKSDKKLLERKRLCDKIYRERKKAGIDTTRKRDDNALVNQDWRKYFNSWRASSGRAKKAGMELHNKYYEYRIEAINKYSNGTNKCNRCGIADMRVLDIDHINNDGSQHRKEIGNLNTVWWLQKNGYPEGFQILCRNCNWIKEMDRKQSQNLERWSD